MVNAHPVKVARLRSRSATPTSPPGMCLRETRECFGVGPRYDDAAEAWAEAKFKHRLKMPDRFPRAVPVFWTGGSHGHGHVALTTGFDGMCWSMDIRRPGWFDCVPIEEIHDKWGLTLVGWSEDLNGVVVYKEKP